MTSSGNLQSILIDAQPYVLALAALAITLGALIGNQDMFDSVLSYFGNLAHGSSKRLEKGRSSAPRTRAQQITASKNDTVSVKVDVVDSYYFPGLVNMSGTYCFLNSPLQALASLAYLQSQVESIHQKAERWDVPTPVIDSLRSILNDLNTPRPRRSAIRPASIVQALSIPDPTGVRSRTRLFSSREHQDAQELFQLISSSIQDEANEVDSESQKDLGLASVDRPDQVSRKEASKNVFEGWTANRRSCVQCGYTEAVMHFPFDNLNLAVPRVSACTLQDCVAGYTQIELLDDCICRKCSLLATLQKLTEEANRLTVAAVQPDASSSKKKRAKDAVKLQARVQHALDENRIEDDLKDVKLEKVFSPCSTKQVMIARPPPVLVVHLNRSSYYGYGGAHKNSCRVVFPEILDLTPYTTSGALSLKPQSPISAHAPPQSLLNAFQDPSSSAGAGPSKPSSHPALYRLSAVVCHYGAHSFGHYVCFRRKPGAGRATSIYFDRPQNLKRPRVPHTLTCVCDICAVHGRIRDSNHDEDYDPFKPPIPNTGWLRISDDSVEEVGIQRVLAESASAFMLYYERVVYTLHGKEKESSRRKQDVAVGTSVLPKQIDTVMEGIPQPMHNHAVNGSAVQAGSGHGHGHGAEDGMHSPRSSEETITPENARLASPVSPEDEPMWDTEDKRSDETMVVKEVSPKVDGSDDELEGSNAKPIPFPASEHSSSYPHRGRIVRSVSAIRSRTASSSSNHLSQFASGPIPYNDTAAQNGRPRENGNSPVVSGEKAYTTRSSESPSQMSPTYAGSEKASSKKSRSASRKQGKSVNGGPKAPPRTGRAQ